jgi:hypothetical protein
MSPCGAEAARQVLGQKAATLQRAQSRSFNIPIDVPESGHSFMKPFTVF